MGDITREITYFEYCGEINTEKVLSLARERCGKLGIKKVVVASETGRSALKALEIFHGMNIEMIVVTHYPASTWGPKGDIPIGLMRKEYSKIREKLLEKGVKIIQGTRPFSPPSRHINWEYPTPEGIIDKILEIFGAGTKIAIEVALMATDAGEVDEGEEIISCAGTYKGLDTALVVKTAYSMNFFKNFEVKEIIAKPRCRVKELPEYKFKNWKGDLNKYYEWKMEKSE
ncbi:pyruvate kinase alpha/beta domain-containing protein [Kosmotoga sp. DU53]|uniref:pyruvate kinase alpha/beta domain-containing protein n=1 Tax=Kosmotoga sp. DU53 TaxID=1310160 RepID=UPI0007C56A23|nr:pyruvate kinase alpha/beta domain-containing protein [Kosmotoga sp. DU53]